MIKLHLGCGNIRINGFINIDVRSTDATDKVADVTTLSEFHDNTVDMIYSAGVLEHFSHRITQDVLGEWYRVLKIDGEMIIWVPNFDAYIKHYLRGCIFHRKQSLQNILFYLYGGQQYFENAHKSIFNGPYLRLLLYEEGFRKIKKITPDYFPVNDCSKHWGCMGFSSFKVAGI